MTYRFPAIVAFAAFATVVPIDGTHAQAVDAPGRFVPQHAIAFGAAGSTATGVDATHRLPVEPGRPAIAYVDRSGVLAAASVAQQIAAANPARRGFLIQNLSSGDLWFTSTGTATIGQPSLRLSAGQLYEFPEHGIPSQAIGVAGGSAGQAFAAREW